MFCPAKGQPHPDSASPKVRCVLQQEVHSTVGGTCRHGGTVYVCPNSLSSLLANLQRVVNVQLALHRKWGPETSSCLLTAALVLTQTLSLQIVFELPLKMVLMTKGQKKKYKYPPQPQLYLLHIYEVSGPVPALSYNILPLHPVRIIPPILQVGKLSI